MDSYVPVFVNWYFDENETIDSCIETISISIDRNLINFKIEKNHHDKFFINSETRCSFISRRMLTNHGRKFFILFENPKTFTKNDFSVKNRLEKTSSDWRLEKFYLKDKNTTIEWKCKNFITSGFKKIKCSYCNKKDVKEDLQDFVFDYTVRDIPEKKKKFGLKQFFMDLFFC